MGIWPLRPDSAGHLQPAEAGQHEVEKDQSRLVPLHTRKGSVRVRSLLDLVALALQVGGDQSAQVLIVVYDQNGYVIIRVSAHASSRIARVMFPCSGVAFVGPPLYGLSPILVGWCT